MQKISQYMVMHPVDDPPVMDLINGVLSQKALVDFLKGGSPDLGSNSQIFVNQ